MKVRKEKAPAENVARTEGDEQGGLPPDVQEHLGRRLRTAYKEVTGKPEFLGDPALPAEFEPHIQTLADRDKARAAALKAVERALTGGQGRNGEDE